jgi:hypothetical protein
VKQTVYSPRLRWGELSTVFLQIPYGRPALTAHPNRFPVLRPAPVSLLHRARRLLPWLFLALGVPAMGGCAVIAVADVAASVVVGTAGLAVDAAVGTAKIAGKAVGKTADLMFGSDPAP